MSDLWDRLEAAKKRVPVAVPAPPPPAKGGVLPLAPEGWTWIAPHVARRKLEFELEKGFWDVVSPGLNAQDWEGVLCFDTETTGLSGGAGTLAFLVGWASLVDTGSVPRVLVEQYFLRDHPGETDLIAALDPEFRKAKALVSFNGASFDIPLLRSRWSLQGNEFPHRPHRDDLHPSRRLWKRVVDSCRLSRLEQLVLGLHRRDDVPGALVPELWYAYLRAGAQDDFVSPLEGALRHHAQDVYSLLCLDLLLHSMRADPTSSRWGARLTPWATRAGLARITDGGLLHPSLSIPVPVGLWGWTNLLTESNRSQALQTFWDGRDVDVGLALAASYKKLQDPRALEVWEQLWVQHGTWPALLEALKWLEHRQKTPQALEQALSWIDDALNRPFWPTVWRDELLKRRARLRQRQERRPSGSGTSSSAT